MLKESLIFRILWWCIKYSGLQTSKIRRSEKMYAYSCFIFLVFINFILYIVEFVQNDDFEARLGGFQTFPFYIQIFFECSNFAIKSKEVDAIFNKLDELFIKTKGDESFFTRGYFYFKIYFLFQCVLGIMSAFGGITLFAITGKTPVLIYTPYPNGLGFFLIWLLQSTFFIYIGIIINLNDQILVSFIIFLSFYLKALRRKIRGMKASELTEIVRLNLEIKR